MSSVGLEGLNLPCANLMVKVVRMSFLSSLTHSSISPFQTPNWSVQEDDQLIGQIYR